MKTSIQIMSDEPCLLFGKPRARREFREHCEDAIAARGLNIRARPRIATIRRRDLSRFKKS